MRLQGNRQKKGGEYSTSVDEETQRRIDASPEALRLIRLEGMEDGLMIAITIAESRNEPEE